MAVRFTRERFALRKTASSVTFEEATPPVRAIVILKFLYISSRINPLRSAYIFSDAEANENKFISEKVLHYIDIIFVCVYIYVNIVTELHDISL